MKTKTMTTLHSRKSTNRSPLRLGLPRVQSVWIIRGFLLIPLVLAWFALSPSTRAVLPAPDGGYAGGNTAEGDGALFNLTTGTDNTANGFNALFSNNTGSANTANGFAALQSNTTGFFNTATGVNALTTNTTGSFNTATGSFALQANTTGNDNTATGLNALQNNTTGFDNTAEGYHALFNNNTGARNTATGFNALASNTTGGLNTATGLSALFSNTTGYYNTANGVEALYSNATGNSNTAEGYHALYHNTGSINIGLGVNGGLNLTTGSHNIDIGNGGVAAESATIRIGGASQTRTFIAAIRGVTTANANALPVVIDSAGQLGTMSSSKRFKKEIKPMDQTSEAILGLKPVTFHYKSDSTGTPQFGLIAEEVAKVNPDLVVRDDDGQIYTVRYEAVNAMLLNEFLKEHRKVEEQSRKIQEQEATIAQLKKEMKTVVAHLEEQDSKIQKVSDQLELGRRAAQMAMNDQ
jgi:trimeric autotransporter adhesin